MSIALAGISLPILGVLMARWNETHEALRHHVFNVLRLALAVIGLAVSTVGGAVVLGDPDSEPSYVFVLVQSLAVTWGLMYAAYPLLLDLAADLRQAMPVRLWRLLTSALSVLIMLGAVVLLFVTLPWWYTLSYVVAILVVVLPLVMIWENKARPAIARWLESPEDDAERPRRT